MLAANGQTPVAKYGQLKIFNGKVSDQAGNPVVLRGMSMFWSGYPEGAPFYNATTIKWLRDDWCVDVIRATMSVETGSTNYVNNHDIELAKIKTVIQACIDNGIYVIVDFHTHNAENYKTQAKQFFTEIATAYKQYPNILYETFNEPINQSWSGTIKPYHNELIQTIRAIDDNIIICGTRTYSQDVDEAANDPVTGTNIAYTLHYYANSHKASLRQKATNALNKGVALFVTEYGTCDASGNNGFNAAESQTWWDFLEANKLSSCNWAVDNKSETSAALNPGTGISGWTANQLSQSGTLVKAYIKGKCNSVLVTGSLTISFAGDKVSYNAGETVTMTAAATISSGTVARVDYYDGTTLLSSKTTSPYTLATSTLSSGGHNITAKSYNAAGALVAESPLYTISIVGASNVSTTGITDQFETAKQFSEMTGGTNDASCAANSVTGAAAGIYWFEDRDAATAFKAEATRTGNGTLQYLVSQEQNQYNVVGFNFGEYCVAGAKQKYTLDLSKNAVFKITVSAPTTNTTTLDLKIQMKDADGTVIAINKLALLPDGTVDAKNWYKYEIGFSKNHVTPDFLSLTPGSTTNFVFDFKNALSIKNPNKPNFPADINTNNADFDWAHVAEVVIVPVNKDDTGTKTTPTYQPLAFTDQKIIFSGLSLGDPSLGVDICTTPKAVTVTDISYCEGATDAVALKATGITGLTLNWYTDATGGVANTVAPIPSTSVAGVTTYYVSQATSSPNTCEGPRTPLKVTIAAPATADAGTNQAITTATMATLTGTGSAVGTWTLQTGPTGATVTFGSTTTGTVTASGLTVDGTYTFKYTVAGTAPCAAVSATVNVVKTTPVCATPTTANAGSNQSITTATTATLTGTGTAVGTWSVVTSPTGATVTLGSTTTGTVTASGLTADGTYTFKYTVKGTSPCVDASATVNVVKATPVCTTPTTANAGSNQSITTATTATLTGTGTTVGTWSVVTSPTGATVTFGSTTTGTVTASGLTADGTYTFKYTVKGTSPCVDASATVNVVKATPVCATPTTANAGSNQSITTATTATLTGTGTTIGTWSVVTKPSSATVTFSPSATAASVTANGLTADGTYTFKYTVTGASPCVDASATMNVVKATPVCTTPTTASAGTNQSITSATTTTLAGTGTKTGTWSLVTGPTGVTVGFSPSAASASVTVNGLTANGTYTFKYTVTGTSPCVDASATVNVVKSSPSCTNPPTAVAGSNQAITSATTVTLTGTGSATGTWSLVTGPSAVTFSPTGSAALVTVNGLTANGTYTFKYTVTGTSPCADATSTVDVVKTAPVCTNPPTASAGANQNITTATSATLSGTGTAAGTWSVVTKPTAATVSFSSSTGSSVTANGLTVDGTYTFKYTVAGISPCADATSTVDVVKSAPLCTNPPTANAGSGQSISTATSVSLTGTGSDIGTWSLVSGPSAVSFSPTGPAALVTVNGLTAFGTYTFKYTVKGVSPCADATSRVEVVKSICTAPPTANAGTGKSITTETSVSLTGTGSDIGIWSLVSGPSAVNFSTSGAASTVTVDGLTAVGTYIFKYTVKGVSPCADATSMVEIGKTTTTAAHNAYLIDNIKLYPNPVTDRLLIDMGQVYGSKSLRVVDVLGKTVLETTGDASAEIVMTDLSRGMYFVQIETESGTVTKSVIKQ